jgi:hypothetical protein
MVADPDPPQDHVPEVEWEGSHGHQGGHMRSRSGSNGGVVLLPVQPRRHRQHGPHGLHHAHVDTVSRVVSERRWHAELTVTRHSHLVVARVFIPQSEITIIT